MKPLNLDNSPCTPTSSKCIIWQGEDIPCINLCKGDTISDVTYKLATELCTVLDTLNVSNYDLSCFNINACGPDDFKALIQFLIDRICELENVEAPAAAATGADCPTECLLTAAECFGGGTVNLVDYVNQIADKICDIVTAIDINKSDINNLEIRVTTIENTPAPTFTIPSFILDCDVAALSAGVSYQIDVILEAFINDVWCNYQAVLGTSGEIAASIVPACSFGTDVTTDPNWTASPSTLAESLTNVWIVLCELYNAPAVTVSELDTDTIDMTVTGGPAYVVSANIADTDWVDLDGFDFYPVSIEKPKVRKIGKTLHFKGQVYIPLSNDGGSTLITLGSSTAYYSESFVAPYTGAGGGVLLNAAGSVTFNQGSPVIPTSVLPALTNLDDVYLHTHQMATRPIDLDATYGTVLTSHINVGITASKTLYISTIKDEEITATRAAGYKGTSPLRLVTSNVRSGEYVPDYIAATTDIHNAPSNADFPLTSATKNITWPFSCDAGEETDLGGFIFRLDGLIAYIS